MNIHTENIHGKRFEGGFTGKVEVRNGQTYFSTGKGDGHWYGREPFDLSGDGVIANGWISRQPSLTGMSTPSGWRYILRPGLSKQKEAWMRESALAHRLTIRQRDKQAILRILNAERIHINNFSQVVAELDNLDVCPEKGLSELKIDTISRQIAGTKFDVFVRLRGRTMYAKDGEWLPAI